MKKIIFVLSVFLLLVSVSLNAQYNSNYNQNIDKFGHYLKISGFTPSVSLGLSAGFAKFESTGMGVGMFAEIKTESFSLVPQANYWKVDNMNNFEMAGLVRLRFKTGTMEPYVDGGIGMNFLNDKRKILTEGEKNETKVGLDLGGGIDFSSGANYTLFFDAKYKIIVGDPNIKGIVLSGGIKFSL